MSFNDLKRNAKTFQCSFVDPAGGTTVEDPNTYVSTYVPTTPIILEGIFTDLSTSEKVKMTQLQDDSTHKIITNDTATGRTINNKFRVTVDGQLYQITGTKKPVLSNSWLTFYVKI